MMEKKITIVGYSGGGILASKATMKLNVDVNHVIYVGAPAAGLLVETRSPISVIWAGKDGFSMLTLVGAKSYHYSGFHAHGGYFHKEYIENTVRIIGGIVGSPRNRSGGYSGIGGRFLTDFIR